LLGDLLNANAAPTTDCTLQSGIASISLYCSLHFVACSISAGLCACSAPVSWLEHEGTGNPWHAIAKALSVDAHDLLFWEKLAKTVHIPKLPGFQPEEKSQLLLVCFLCLLVVQLLQTAAGQTCFDHYPVSLYVAVDVLMGVKFAALSELFSNRHVQKGQLTSRPSIHQAVAVSQ